MSDRDPIRALAEKIEHEREHSHEVWKRLRVDMPSARMILALIRASGGDVWHSSPTRLEFDAPHSLPKPLRRALFLYGALNAKAIGKLLEAEEAES